MELLQLLQSNDFSIEKIENLLEKDASLLWKVDELGNSPLHYAAKTGPLDVVQFLIKRGLNWNAVNYSHISAGQVALEHKQTEIYDFLLAEGIRTEYLLTALEKAQSPLDEGNDDFLKRKLIYKDGLLLDDQNNAVMMNWEGPLMAEHVKVMQPKGKVVLNVGFGLGMIDTMIQNESPEKHVIIEAHPDVYAKMLEWGWDKRPNVQIIFDKWQNVIESIGPFDAIFFDTFGEDYSALKYFHEHIPNLLRDESSVYTFFNGLAGTNAFFHQVYNNIAAMDLQEMGLDTEYTTLAVASLGDEVWRETARPYYNLEYYDLPVCRLLH